ncbi:MAG: hypothetical protein V1743_00545 [Nanoarchaeota archaeon]
MKHLKSIIGTLVALGTIVYAGTACAKDGWAQFTPAYHTAEQRATLRMEGGSTLTDGLSTYGFIDADATPEKPADLENFYAEARLNQNLGKITPVLKPFGIAIEYNGGNGLEDIVRAGITFSPAIAAGNFTFVKFYPVETSGDKGLQLSMFTSQTLPYGFATSILVDYNITADAAYAEQEIGFKVTPQVTLVGQSRLAVAEGMKPAISPAVGLRYAF